MDVFVQKRFVFVVAVGMLELCLFRSRSCDALSLCGWLVGVMSLECLRQRAGFVLLLASMGAVVMRGHQAACRGCHPKKKSMSECCAMFRYYTAQDITLVLPVSSR